MGTGNCEDILYLFEVTSYDLLMFAYVAARDTNEAEQLARLVIQGPKRRLLCSMITKADSELIQVDGGDLWSRMNMQDTPSVLHVIRNDKYSAVIAS